MVNKPHNIMPPTTNSRNMLMNAISPPKNSTSAVAMFSKYGTKSSKNNVIMAIR